MRRGQIAPRLLMILFSWIALIVTIAFMFIFISPPGDSNAPPLDAVSAPNVEVTLATFLRQSVDLGGDKVPMAEYIAFELSKGRTSEIEKATNEFIEKTLTTKQEQIVIRISDGENLIYGDQPSQAGNIIRATSASTLIPLPPTGDKKITVTYSELEVTAIRRYR